jgi:2-succinyl-5-enolpyruvyl-6-hydroxy-3-cyclohexene-1-carboxylate synthase
VSTDPARQAFAFVGAFVDELVRAGVRHVCVAPGSRSTPIAMTVAERSELRLWVHLDERSAAFFALGIARASGVPAAVVCTSGTAAANFFPAVVEAQAAGVPLLVLTADRPPELREVGAAQTVDQNRLYGAHAKWFVDVALPEATPPMLRHARALAHRAVATAVASPAGPVHLNFPFREPLVPVRMDAPSDVTAGDRGVWTGREERVPWVSIAPHTVVPDAAAVRQIAERLRGASRPLIACGPQYDAAVPASVARLAAISGAPILADPLSQLRWGTHDRDAVIETYDATLRSPQVVAILAPDFILRLGAAPTSKPLLEYLAVYASVSQVVVSDGRWPDPVLAASGMLRADATAACDTLAAELEGHSAGDGWRQRWLALDAAASRALRAFSEGLDEPFEGRALAEIVDAVPDGGTLFVSSSMPVRDLDTFGRGGARRVRVLANRGANGIDGVVSSALGAGAVSDGPLVLAIGDIALYHDMNGLLAAKQYRLDATIVLINNDGGGIFSFLPQAAHPEHFEKLFGTPHGLDFAHVARLYGADYCRADTWAAFRAALRAGGPGLRIVEMRTERSRNVELHRLAREAVARTLDDIKAG